MKTNAYGERDYSFGQTMLTLRTAIGLTQAGLADHLGVSRRAVGEWEGGNSYPKAHHLKELISLAVEQQAFPAGQEAKEIRALWKAARQKVLLDERWLAELLAPASSPDLHLVPKAVEETMAEGGKRGGGSGLSPDRSESRGLVGSNRGQAPTLYSYPPVEPLPASGPRVDWDDALAVPTFYGREEELALLSQWIVQEHCRVVGVLGMGGIGKSALSVSAMYQLALGTGHEPRTVPTPYPFEVVIFRSLRNALSCEDLLAECLQMLSSHSLSVLPATLEQRLSVLLEYLRKVRVLVVLDNLESLLEGGDVKGHFRSGFEAYGQLLRRVAETEHQSCLLFTSREKPSELRPLEGKRSAVRSLRLAGLSVAACKQLFMEKGVALGSPSEDGTEEDMEQLVGAYGGNPLALKIVAETIIDLFAGEIAPFLAGGSMSFGSISDLLDEQFARLSALERTVLCWLAIVREPVTLGELLHLWVTPLQHGQLLEAIDGLYRRSLIERGKRAGSFTLQSVVLEYVTAVLIAQASREIQERRLHRLIEHGLELAHAKEYVRQMQERLLIDPLLMDLQSVYRGRTEQAQGRGYSLLPASTVAPVEEHVLGLLDELRALPDIAQGYGPANLIALLRLLRGNLNGLDLSMLSIRGAYLQGIQMQGTSLSGARISDTVFTEAFDVICSVATSLGGKLWAAGTQQGEVRVWHQDDQSLRLGWQAHTDIVWTLAFSPDARALATGGFDGTVKLWDLDHGVLLWMGWHTDIVGSLAFAPDGRVLASCGADAVVRLWDVPSGTNLQTLSGQGSVLWALAWSPDGSLLAGGGFDGSIQLWHLQGTQSATCVAIDAAHTNWIMALAFAPNGRQLASGSWDSTVKLWDVGASLGGRPPRGDQCQTLSGHTERVYAVAWSGDGRVVASAGFDNIIWLWDVDRRSYRAVLHGHTALVYSVAFTPDGSLLLSGSEDGTVRVWDVTSGQCLRIVEGCAVTLYDVAWSPDSTRLASVGTDRLVTIWDMTSEALPKVLRGHSWHLFGVVWSPDGRLLASSGRDNAIRVWDPATEECLQVFQDPDYADTMFYGVAWSPDGRLLASGSYVHGVQVWDMVTRTRCWVGQHPTRIRRVAWSPDGTRLAGSGDDGNVCLWAASDGTGQALGTVPTRLQGHSGRVMSVAWSPDGKRLVSAGDSRDGGELLVWDVENQRASPSGELVQTLKVHPGSVFTVVWSPTGEVLVSGGSDGSIRWWEMHSGACLRVCEGHEGGVWALKVSPDGRLLASSGNDGTVRVWDLESARLLRTLRHDRPYERLNITGIRGLTEAEITSLRALGAVEGVGP